MAEKQRIYGERYPIDEDFLAALAHMPPASGAALGFDRLVMLATGATRIEQVLWTPVVEASDVVPPVIPEFREAKSSGTPGSRISARQAAPGSRIFADANSGMTGGAQAGGGPNTSTALRPPKANEFDIA